MEDNKVIKLDPLSIIAMFLLFFSIVLPVSSPVHLALMECTATPSFAVLLVMPLLALLIFSALTWLQFYPEKWICLTDFAAKKEALRVRMYYIDRIRLGLMLLLFFAQLGILQLLDAAILWMVGFFVYLVIVMVLYVRKMRALKR